MSVIEKAKSLIVDAMKGSFL